jgi:small conductance mechanosensitive channel
LLAGAGIVGLALGFAFQDLTANFISGVFIAFRKPFEVGETVETNGFIGNIEEIHLRTTTIRTFQGLHLLIPNKEIFQKLMINHSRTDERRIEIEFSISLENDLELTQRVAKEAIQKLSYLHKEKQIEFYFTGLQDNSIRVAIWYWIYNRLPPGFMVARHEGIVLVMKAFSQNNISVVIPIPLEGNSFVKEARK